MRDRSQIWVPNRVGVLAKILRFCVFLKVTSSLGCMRGPMYTAMTWSEPAKFFPGHYHINQPPTVIFTHLGLYIPDVEDILCPNQSYGITVDIADLGILLRYWCLYTIITSARNCRAAFVNCKAIMFLFFVRVRAYSLTRCGFWLILIGRCVKRSAVIQRLVKFGEGKRRGTWTILRRMLCMFWKIMTRAGCIEALLPCNA